MAYVGEMQYLTIGDSTYSIPTSGGSSVSITRSLTSGTKSATITVDGTSYDIYSTNNDDTKNTAGSTNSTSMLYLIGATSQAANPQTYSSNKLCYNTGLKSYAESGDDESQVIQGSSYFYVQVSDDDAESTSKLSILGDEIYLETEANNKTIRIINEGSGDVLYLKNLVTPTNDSDAATKGYIDGLISGITDEKLKWTASTSSNAYYPLQSTSTATTSTANTLNGISFYQYYNTAGGYRRLDLGNSTAYKSTGGAYGTIRLYGAAATYYGDLVPGVLGTTSGDGHISANRTWTLPDKTGTVALTSDLPTVPTNISAFTNDSGYITSADVPEGASAYTGTISAVGTSASNGTSNGFARGDHVHNITKTTIDTQLGTGSGTTKFYREDGTWATPAYTTNTDTKMKFTSKSDNYSYKVALGPSSITSGTAYEGFYSTNLTYNPSTSELAVKSVKIKEVTTGFTIAGGSTTSKTLTVSETYTLGAACAKGVTDNSSNTDVTSSDTNLITGRTLYYQLAKKGYTTNTGTVTSVGLSNATDGGLTISGSPVTGSGSITVGHSNVLTSAQTTQAIYPIKIDKNGHISAYGTAVTPLTASSTLDATKLSGTIPSGCYTDTNTTYALSGALSSHKFTSTLTAGGSGSGTSTSDFTLAAGTGITITDDTTNRKMTIACSVSDTNTTYALSNALSSHKFTSTLTAGGSGSGTSTATMEFVAGTGITLTDDTTNKKITIASSLTVPTITLNGSSTTSPSFYAPTGAGTSGQYLKSNGSGAPSWTNFPTIPTITLNGSSTTSPSFYAPTSAGTSGYYLKSSGSGAPTWASITIPTVPTNVSAFTNDAGYTTNTGTVTGTGTSGQLAQWNSASGLTSGPAITISTSSPSGGSNGDIWIVYTAPSA